MRWVLAGIGLLVVIVVFSLAALDQKNVVWVKGTPQCPHCRTDVHLYASVCAGCGRAFDWETYETECTECLSELDAAYYQRRLRGHEKRLEELLAESIAPASAIRDLASYAKGLRSGSCMFCGGSGRWVASGFLQASAGNGGNAPDDRMIRLMKESLEKSCPICFGTGRCVLCGGDHLVDHAREASDRGLQDLFSLHDGIDPHRDPESAEVLFEAIRTFVSRHGGRTEIGSVPAFYHGGALHLEWAELRRDFMITVLDKLP
jgi:hypothetical protein